MLRLKKVLCVNWNLERQFKKGFKKKSFYILLLNSIKIFFLLALITCIDINATFEVWKKYIAKCTYENECKLSQCKD